MSDISAIIPALWINLGNATISPDTLDPVTLTVNIEGGEGTLRINNEPFSGTGTYDVNECFVIYVTPNFGYEVLGWYKNNDMCGAGNQFLITMTEDTTLTIRMQQRSMPMHRVLLLVEEEGTGSVMFMMGGTSATYVSGASFVAIASPAVGYEFVGWYDENDNMVSSTTPSAFTMPDHDIVITARFEVESSSNPEEFVYTRINSQGVESETGNYILFGSYPQTLVTDATLTDSLIESTTGLPTVSDARGWTSYQQYYESGEYIDNYMWYIDVAYENEQYRGVYFTAYRPNWEGWFDPHDPGAPQQFENGYAVNTVYWFKYEPIRWRIVSDNGGSALILCESILDSKEFCLTESDERFYHNGGTGYSSEYALSDVRAWLINTFFNEAFSEAQKALILNNSTDPVFLLSKEELMNSTYGFSNDPTAMDGMRRKRGTDYAKAQGLYVHVFDPDDPYDLSMYDGLSPWLTKSIYTYYLDECDPETGEVIPVLKQSEKMIEGVKVEGSFDKFGVEEAINGVVPALRISFN